MVPVLMIALVPLRQQCMSGPLPPVAVNQAFWADDTQVESLIAGGLAIEAPANYSPVPPAEPPYTVNSVPGLAAGTSNASH